MRWSDVYLNASAVVLGEREYTADAVAAGYYDPGYQQAHGYESVSVAADEILPEDMAVRAARSAISRSGVDPGSVRLVIYVTSTSRQSPAELVSASYVQAKTVPGPACALEVSQTCNAGIAALELAAAYLTAGPAASSALVTTTDKYRLSGGDRYHFDPGNVPGDGATGVLLSRGYGVARLVSTSVTGDGRFSAPGGSAVTADRKAFPAGQQQRLRLMLRSMAALKRECARLALAEAGLDSTEISRWVFANAGLFILDEGFRREFGIEESMTVWDSWGRTIGHLGTGDQIAGLTHLLETGAVRPGDRVALFSNGVGYSYGCAIFEITGEAAWSGDEPA